MNKLFSKIAGLSIGLAMAIGVGVAVASNRSVTSVSATVGSDVTIGDGTYTSAYETGFEDCTTSTTYNSTKTYTSGTDANVKKGWSVYYGTVSTNAKISGSNSVQMRWYSSAKTNYPHAETTSAVSNVKAFKFNYAVGNTNVHFKVQYGTNGSSWTDVSTVSPSGTGTTEYSHEFSSAISSFYFRVLVCLGTAPSSGNYNFRIDDIVFGSPKAVACTVTLNKNGGSGGTDSVSATKGSAMPTLASAPTRTGYTFAGYYDDASAGTQYYTANRASARNWDKDGTTATLYAHWTANQYNINYYDQGGSDFSGEHESGYPTKHTYGTETTLKGATKGGYNFDGWFTTSECTGSAVTSLGATSYTDAISLYAKWTATGNIYSITTTVTNGTYSGDTTITDNGGVASVTIAPTGDYKLPASVSVSGADHTYNASTGVISLSNATGNVTISAAMVALTEYSITVNKTNASYTGDTTIKESRTASLTFEPDSGYGQPASVTVTGATYTWTRGTGVLSLSNPTGNVTVTYAAAGNELTSITLGTQKTAYVLGEDFSMPVVTAHYSVADDKVVTGSATESGYDPYSIGNQSITISYTEGGITQTSSYSVAVSVKEIETTVTWNLVTAASDISAGDTVIIAGAYGGDYKTKAMSTTQNNNNRGATDITVSNSKATITNSVQQFKVEAGTVANTFSFKDEAYNSGDGGYIYAASSSSNHLKTETTKSDNSSFTLSVSNNEATLTAQGNNTHNLMRYNSGNTIFSCYGNGQEPLSLYKKVAESSGTADLIRITASYNGGEKYVGDSISASDFTVAKQLNTGTQLIPVESGWTIDVATLTSTSNNVLVSYTENNITESALVVVPATERSATLEEVVLSVGAEAQLDGYIAWSGATWNLNDIKVQYIWSDSEYDTEATLQSLVDGGEATISPATPTLGATSFTVTYSYLEVSLTNNVVTLDEAVRSDYVRSMSWGNTTAAHFKHFSGEQLTEEIVNTWHVKATFAGAGEGERLYWGDYDLYIGSKQITSLPYTWTTADDGEALSIHYGEDVDGNEFVKTNATAVGNICATINPIDHDETISGLIDKSTGWTTEQSSALSDQDFGTRDLDANISMTGVKSSGSTNVRIYSGTLRTYANNEMYFTPSNGAIIKTINLANISAAECSDSEATQSGNVWTIKNGTETITFTGLNKVTVNSDIVVEYQINGSETTTVHYANDMDHFDAQKTVVAFAKFMNTTMNGENVCSGTFANLESAWGTVRDKYDELFGESTTLDATELAWAKNMLKYANAAWGSDAENACVEKAMKTYEICIAKHGVDPFMFESDGTTPLRSISSTPSINMLISKNSSAVITIIVISAVSLAAIGGYFLFRKKKED